jgi:hypothetical protein
MMRPLLIVLFLVVPIQIACAHVTATEHHSFDDLLDAVRALRKKTIIEAYFRLEAPQFTAQPFFSPDAKGEVFFVLPVARVFPETPPAEELEKVLSALRRSSLFTPAYDSQRRRLAFYPPEAVADLRRHLAGWLLAHADVSKHPYLQFADEVVVARIPNDREAEFLDLLVTCFLRSNRKELKCIVGWN